MISTLETVDAVPIVRCRECKKHGTEDCPMMGHYEGEDETDDEDFCSYGEKLPEWKDWVENLKVGDKVLAVNFDESESEIATVKRISYSKIFVETDKGTFLRDNDRKRFFGCASKYSNIKPINS